MFGVRSPLKYGSSNKPSEPAGILANAISLPSERYPDAATRNSFQESILDEIEALPGVESAAIVSQLPFSGVVNSISITVPIT